MQDALAWLVLTNYTWWLLTGIRRGTRLNHYSGICEWWPLRVFPFVLWELSLEGNKKHWFKSFQMHIIHATKNGFKIDSCEMYRYIALSLKPHQSRRRHEFVSYGTANENDIYINSDLVIDPTLFKWWSLLRRLIILPLFSPQDHSINLNRSPLLHLWMPCKIKRITS